jgi:hypothetical protein
MAVRRYERPVAKYRKIPQIVKAQPNTNAAVPAHESERASNKNGKA